MAGSAAEILTLDRLDRQLVQALSVDGRASFRALADVLGASEQTVARRYRRLRDAGALRIVVIRNPRRVAHRWIVRVRVRPPSAHTFARAVAQRRDVSWVGLIAGGTEVTFAINATTAEQRDALLLERLPHARDVLDVTASAVLHAFNEGPATEWHGLDDPLTAEQVAALQKVRGGAGATPTERDEPLLSALARDGRATYAALAAETGDTEARVARRVEALLDGGEVIVDLDLAAAALGFHTGAWLWLTVAPSDLDATARAIVHHPECAFSAAVTGPATLIAAVTTRDDTALYEYLTHSIGALGAVRAVEVAPILRRYKQAGTLMDGPRL
jgi:DNA-binding Lrp family transcriptional regulator